MTTRVPAETPSWRTKFDQAYGVARSLSLPLNVYRMKFDGGRWYFAPLGQVHYFRPEGAIRRRQESK